MNSVWTLGDWLQYLFSFVFVIGLLLTLLWTLRKLQNGQGLLRKNTQRLQTVETLSVGTRQKIMLIRVDDREILVGVSVQNITVLSACPDKDHHQANNSGKLPAALDASPENLTP
ncbi:flagellar biosynthetic protein FliO [Limnohabitans sp. Rim8]|uniref:flagellar biosynthetic protein FliO n=1 Tax=Limnohabitans sp. Rim8 TaxID=1100718 RepID=UPI0025F2200A|nr:flagellar biosynthetic protein FliO [Limnohabitans sp. Rim8]